MKREIIDITTKTRGTVVFAKNGGRSYFGDWILLIDHVDQIKNTLLNEEDELIFTHIAFRLGNNMEDVIVQSGNMWGFVKMQKFEFYKPTEEDKNAIKQILKLHNKRFVKILNKIIPR